MARHRRGGGRRSGNILGLHVPQGNKFYVDLGIFTLIFIVYLWVAPKLIKKPAGTPPRSGSNAEQQMVNKTANGQAPEAVGAPGTAPSPPNTAGASTSAPAGVSGSGMGMGMGAGVGSANTLAVPLSTTTGTASTGSNISKVPIGGAYRARVNAFPAMLTKLSYQ